MLGLARGEQDRAVRAADDGECGGADRAGCVSSLLASPSPVAILRACVVVVVLFSGPVHSVSYLRPRRANLTTRPGADRSEGERVVSVTIDGVVRVFSIRRCTVVL